MVGLLHAVALWCFCLLAESYETTNHYHLIAPMSVSTLAYISKYPKSVTQLHNSIDNSSLSAAYESKIINRLIPTISLT